MNLAAQFTNNRFFLIFFFLEISDFAGVVTGKFQYLGIRLMNFNTKI
jgi:hypothetical protein